MSGRRWTRAVPLAVAIMVPAIAAGAVLAHAHRGSAGAAAPPPTPRATVAPQPSPEVVGCLNEGNPASSFRFDAVGIVRTAGILDEEPLRRAVIDNRTVASRLAVEAAAAHQLFAGTDCGDDLGVWYQLTFASRGDPNMWAVLIASHRCAGSAPGSMETLCADLARVLGIPRAALRPSGPLIVEESVHVTRRPGLFVMPPLDVAIADAQTATQLARDLRSLPPAFTGVPGEPALEVNCPNSYGTAYTLTFTPPRQPPWTATVDVMGCAGVHMPAGPDLLDLGDTAFLRDLGTALGLAPDQVQPRPCELPLPSGGHCYPQPTPAP